MVAVPTLLIRRLEYINIKLEILRCVAELHDADAAK